MFASYRSQATDEHEQLPSHSPTQSMRSDQYPEALMLDEIAPSNGKTIEYEMVDEEIEDFENEHCSDQNGPNFITPQLE